MKKIIFLSLLIVFIFLPNNLVIADGGMIPREGEYKDIYEPSQTSLIVYQDGVEDIYLKVNYEGETNKFVWIIPTPSLPKADTAPKDIFEELSMFTGEALYQPLERNYSNGDAVKSEDTDVIIHSQEQIGIYEITILSSAGVNSLFDWLADNDYPVKAENKEILNWYVKKEWYFTAVRINSSSNLEDAVDMFAKIDNTVNKDNFVTKLADYYINSFKNNNFTQFKNSLSVFKTLLPDEFNEVDINDSIELFNESKEDIYAVTDEDWYEAKQEMEQNITDELENDSSQNISKYSNYIEPIKISFNVNTIVYPLKISQISTRVPTSQSESIKTNEVLLYILSDEQVTAPGFDMEYAQAVNKEKWKNLESLKEIINEENLFLTKLRRDFARIEMDEDVYLINGTTYNAVAENETRLLSASYKASESYLKVKNKVQGSAMVDRLKGKIVLKVEDQGKAFYINPITKKYHYLGRPNDAFDVMREQGVGISNSNLEKIPVGLDNLSGPDSDNDGLSDLFEDAIGTDKNKADSDGDGYGDKEELSNNFNPKGIGAIKYDLGFSNTHKGKIFLQVEGEGEAWYINPSNGKRYFLGRPADAFSVMRNLGLGISNSDFDSL